MTKKKPFISQLTFQFNCKVAFVVTLSLTILVSLGFWQLDRAEQKQQMQIALQQSKVAKPNPIQSLAIQNMQNLNHQRVQLTGHYLNNKSIYISNKLYQGKLGFEVITPFKLKSSDQIVLISRGWIELSYQHDQLPAVDLINGEHELVGVIHLPPKNSFFLAEKVHSRTWPIRLHHFQINTIAELFQTPVTPYVVRLEPGNQGALQAFWPAVRFNSSNSIAYAIQWFMMALAVLLISIIKSTNIVQLIQSKQ